MKSQPVVFWDIDGTLVQESLEREFISFLRSNKLVPTASIPIHFLSLALRIPFPKWHQLKLCYLKGVSAEELDAWSRECWSKTLENKLFSDAHSAIENIEKLGAKQVILSGTITPLAKLLASKFGIQEIIAANPEIKNNLCTGRTIQAHLHGKTKVSRVQEWLTKNNRQWSETIAIANHWDDRFLLERCAIPIAAHPDEKLRSYAKQRQWQIIDNLIELNDINLVEG